MEGRGGLGVLEGLRCVLELSFVQPKGEHKQCRDFRYFGDEIVRKIWCYPAEKDDHVEDSLFHVGVFSLR